jgi:predicted GIY-YIG superfamily endonuclease
MKYYNDNSITMTSIGIVYKLHHDDSKHVYVGSTMLEPRLRLSSHRAKLKSGVGAIAKYFKDCNFEGLQLSIIAKYMVCDHKHILAYEQLHINREKAINSNKSFKVANPEYEAQLKKRFREIHGCQCGGSYSLNNASRHNRSGIHQKWIAS